MPPKSNEYLVDTDILIEHLTFNSTDKDSYLADTYLEQEIILRLLSSLKILGLHSRYSLLVPKYKSIVKNMNDALMCVVADYNKLPIITLNKNKYAGTKLKVYHPVDLKLM
uniref:PIN domain-containing protein n=1 Tax=uncultured Ignavibacteria bacterium Rifle_16ft_4_minimus_38491 TaxID=1665105 RepID=A0A0H4T786_9BACT|nr:hypothetical protein [uncultured Ignavibacteria bacterium Rifle_16ft_4_minimus_38491]